MRKAIVAAIAAALFFTAGCQDQQARDQNAKLQAELDLMKASKPAGSNDELIKLMLADRQGGGSENLERKLNTYTEDVTAGQAKLEKLIKESSAENDKRMDEVEDRLKRVSDLEATINTLKGMIETLESKVKSVDPNEVLNVQRDLINKEADLRVEKQAKDAALAEAALLKGQLADAKVELKLKQDELDGMLAGDITKHPRYKALLAENETYKSDLAKKDSDYKALADKYKSLEDHLKKGSNPPKETPEPLPDDYAFSGSVVEVSRGARADGPSYLLVGAIKSGANIPPIGTELVVLDAKNKPVCKVKVVRYYHTDDNEDLPIEELGCSTLDEKATRPVAKGDSAVWVTEKKAGTGDGKSGTDDAKAGGD